MVRNKQQIKRIISKYISTVDKVISIEKVFLFGSYNNGKPNKWSDIDLAVVSKDFEFMNEYIAMLVLSRLKESVDYSIEPIPLRPADIKNPPIGSIQYTIINKGRLVYSNK